MMAQFLIISFAVILQYQKSLPLGTATGWMGIIMRLNAAREKTLALRCLQPTKTTAPPLLAAWPEFTNIVT